MIISEFVIIFVRIFVYVIFISILAVPLISICFVVRKITESASYKYAYRMWCMIGITILVMLIISIISIIHGFNVQLHKQIEISGHSNTLYNDEQDSAERYDVMSDYDSG